jgi:hypothetical protein
MLAAFNALCFAIEKNLGRHRVVIALRLREPCYGAV